MTRPLQDLIYELALKTRLLKSLQEGKDTIDDLTERQILLLELLHGRETMTISEVGLYFRGLAPSTISSEVTLLWSAKGLLEKTIDPSNQRTRILKLTDHGEKTLQRIRSSRLKAQKALIDALNLDDSEREMAQRILERTIPKIDAMIEQLHGSQY